MSLRLTTDYRLLQHLSAFSLAWVAASFLFVYVLRPITVSQPEPGYHIGTLGKGEPAVRNLTYLSAALRGGETIVILGSSELDAAHSYRFIPNIFFPKHHLARVFTYGRAGFETLGMYGLLYSLRPHLNPGTRLVIMLSPAWFRSTDLGPGSFNVNFNDNVLLQLYWGDDPRSVFHDYLIAHQFDFGSLTPTQEMYLDDPDSMLDWYLPGFIVRTVNARAYSQREKLNLHLAKLAQPASKEHYDAGNGKDLPWDEYEKSAREHELARMKANDLWVRNSYYKLYTHLHLYKNRQYFPSKMNPEPEMDGFRLLIQLLRRSKIKALFVMQPLNPRLYDDLQAFDPVNARIASLCQEYGMAYMDMYTMPYEEGVLRDGQHPGELGWEKVDREISGFFNL